MGKRAERKRSKESRLRHETVYKRSQLEGDLPDEDDTDDKEAAMADPVSTETGEKRFMTEDELIAAAKCGDMPMEAMPPRPYGGAKTWEELDAYQKAADAQMAIEDVDAQFMALKANVMGDMMLEDKAGALVEAMDGFLARMKAVGKKEAAAAVVPPVPPPAPETIPTGEAADPKAATLPERFKAWLRETFLPAPAPGFVDLPTTVTALKSASGQTLLMLHTTNAFQDRDKEFFTDEAIKAYAERAPVGNPVDYWHTPWRLGSVVWHGYGEKALFELIAPAEDAASRELVEHVAADPAAWGCSHRFHYDPSDKESGIYRTLVKSKSTLLPLRAAANPYTAVTGLSAKEVQAMNDMKLEELKGVLSADAYAQAAAFIQGEEGKSKRLVEAGVAHKETETPPAAPPPAPAPSPDAAALATALKAALDPLQAQLAAVTAQATALQAADKARAEMPRAANFFGTVPASRDPQTALTPEQVAAAALLGPGQKATGEDDDPMLRSMQLMFGARS